VKYLLDTNVLSEPRKPMPDSGVLGWLDRVEPTELRLSVITVGEIRRGITKLRLRNDYQQAARYERWLFATLRQFTDRLVPVTADVAGQWGHEDARRPIPTADGLIGATAVVHGWTLVTRNTKDFEHIGVALLNPFTG